jgi:hypothetical protein
VVYPLPLSRLQASALKAPIDNAPHGSPPATALSADARPAKCFPGWAFFSRLRTANWNTNTQNELRKLDKVSAFRRVSVSAPPGPLSYAPVPHFGGVDQHGQQKGRDVTAIHPGMVRSTLRDDIERFQIAAGYYKAIARRL